MSKKLDYIPSCMAIYRQDGVIVGSFTGHMMIYNRNYLIWSCKLNTPPV
jgi:hypothetical protein